MPTTDIDILETSLLKLSPELLDLLLTDQTKTRMMRRNARRDCPLQCRECTARVASMDDKTAATMGCTKAASVDDKTAASMDCTKVATTRGVSASTPARCHIIWATSDYEPLGPGYAFDDPITPERVSGEHGMIVQPRVCKPREVQQHRVRERAEVFTPAWVCNLQNNLVDEAWFGQKDIFNTPSPDNRDWTPRPPDQLIPFFPQSGRTWRDYVRSPRLEITCGEAPYLASRYDAASGGQLIPVERRIGMLDRKLRVVTAHCRRSSPKTWRKWAFVALRSIYGFDYQGDNVLKARENLLYTFLDHYEHFLVNHPQLNAATLRRHKTYAVPEGDNITIAATKTLKTVAEILSWNIWQMDGLNQTIPAIPPHRLPKKPTQPDLFPDSRQDNPEVYRCYIRDWNHRPDNKADDWCEPFNPKNP